MRGIISNCKRSGHVRTRLPEKPEEKRKEALPSKNILKQVFKKQRGVQLIRITN
jgi:hypothetical protein